MASAGSSKGLSDRAGPPACRGGASIALEPTNKRRVSARQVAAQTAAVAEVQNILRDSFELKDKQIPSVRIIRRALEGAGWVVAAAVGDLVNENAGVIFWSESGEERENDGQSPAAAAGKERPTVAAKGVLPANKSSGEAVAVGE